MEQQEYKVKETKIAIAGVGGGGGNAINYMKENGIEKVEFVALNTDFQDLYEKSDADIKIPLGTDGLGAGANPEVARTAAEESQKQIIKKFEEFDMIFITAGMGGGTGTGASPVIAKIAKELGKLTVAIVTKPYAFEGKKKMKTALAGIEELKKYVDSIIVIPNEKLFKIAIDRNLSTVDAYKVVNEVLKIGISTITDLINKKGTVNLDYNDVKSVLSNSGVALFGFGVAKQGEDPMKAVEQATENPLLEQTMKGAKNVLVNFIMNPNFSMLDFQKISNEIRNRLEFENDDEDFIHGIIQDDKVENLQVSIIASNFVGMNDKEPIKPNNEFDSEKDSGIYNVLLPTYE